jgi:hypothetical protein
MQGVCLRRTLISWINCSRTHVSNRDSLFIGYLVVIREQRERHTENWQNMESLGNLGIECVFVGYNERNSVGNTESSHSVYLHCVVLVSVFLWLCWVRVRMKDSENERNLALSRSTQQNGPPQFGVSCATVAKVMSAYTNHMKTSSAKMNSGWKPTLTDRDRSLYMRKDGSNSHTTTAAQVTTELEDPVSSRTVRRELQKSQTHGRLCCSS